MKKALVLSVVVLLGIGSSILMYLHYSNNYMKALIPPSRLIFSMGASDLRTVYESNNKIYQECLSKYNANDAETKCDDAKDDTLMYQYAFMVYVKDQLELQKNGGYNFHEAPESDAEKNYQVAAMSFKMCRMMDPTQCDKYYQTAMLTQQEFDEWKRDDYARKQAANTEP